jgi:hypothetical protein
MKKQFESMLNTRTSGRGSRYSIDAYATGNLGVTPDMAYRFARDIPIDNPCW